MRAKLILIMLAVTSLLSLTSCTVPPYEAWRSDLVASNEARLKYDFAEAEKQAKDSLKIAEESVISAPLVMLSLNLLARIYDQSGDFDKEEEILKKIVQLNTKTDPNARNMDLKMLGYQKLIALYQFKGDAAMADHLFKRLQEYQKYLHLQNSESLVAGFAGLSTRALQLHRQKSGDADTLLSRELTKSTRWRVVDEANTREIVARVYYQMGNHAQSARLLREALMLRACCDEQTEIEGLVNQTVIQGEEGINDQAKVSAEMAERRAKRLPAFTEAQVLVSLADFYAGQGNDLVKAERLYDRALLIQSRVLQRDDPDMMATQTKLAIVATRLSNNSKAGELFKKAFETAKKSEGVNTPSQKALFEKYVEYLRKTNQEKQANAISADLEKERMASEEKEAHRKTVGPKEIQKNWIKYAWKIRSRLTRLPEGILNPPQVSIHVDSDGTVHSPKLLRSSGDQKLDLTVLKQTMDIGPLPKFPEWAHRYVIVSIIYNDRLFRDPEDDRVFPRSIQVTESTEPAVLTPRLGSVETVWSQALIKKDTPFSSYATKKLSAEGNFIPFDALSASIKLDGRKALDLIPAHMPLIVSDVVAANEDASATAPETAAPATPKATPPATTAPTAATPTSTEPKPTTVTPPAKPSAATTPAATTDPVKPAPTTAPATPAKPAPAPAVPQGTPKAH
jgi:tetratricopeptide (TPR) repeat protein/outer membrane biosynthesis protein TonB